MTPPTKTLLEQLRGATRLAVEATQRVTDIVETMHHTIGGGPTLLGRPLERATKLFTAPTYRAIRSITGVVGSGLDLALAKLEPFLPQPGLERNAVLAALNGVMGDVLATSQNPLAIEMELTADGLPLELTREALGKRFAEAKGRLVVLVHGSSMNDAQWLREGHNHGLALARDLAVTALFLRYNSGLHISVNGRQFAELLEQVTAAWPVPVTELVLIGHSMGGLVARSAFVHGELAGHRWRPLATTLVTLGTPHHGSPLERIGHWADLLMGVSRYSAPLAKLGQLRSAGVTDLRYGNVLDEHWEGQDRFAPGGDRRTPVPLPKNVRCFAIAGTLAPEAGVNPPGDGLVPVESALGRHASTAQTLGFGEANQWVAYGTSHLGLLSSQAVYQQLLALLTASS